MSRTALLQDLTDVAGQLWPDELRLFILVATRIHDGQARYGRLDVRRDRRNFARESLEEVIDGFYLGAALLPDARSRHRARRA
jgi:hypothetical protein